MHWKQDRTQCWQWFLCDQNLRNNTSCRIFGFRVDDCKGNFTISGRWGWRWRIRRIRRWLLRMNHLLPLGRNWPSRRLPAERVLHFVQQNALGEQKALEPKWLRRGLTTFKKQAHVQQIVWMLIADRVNADWPLFYKYNTWMKMFCSYTHYLNLKFIRNTPYVCKHDHQMVGYIGKSMATACQRVSLFPRISRRTKYRKYHTRREFIDFMGKSNVLL